MGKLDLLAVIRAIVKLIKQN